MNKYIEFIEYNMKTFKYSYFYLQCNDNMNELEQLNSMLIRAKYDAICGAHSEFIPMNMKYIIDEYTLQYHFNKENITICNGKFNLPSIIYSDNNTLGDILNCKFYNGGITKFFTSFNI
jgi:hypothetical protein